MPFVRGLKDTIFPGCSPEGLPLTIGKGPVDVRERVSRFAFARRRGNRPQIDKEPAGPVPVWSVGDSWKIRSETRAKVAWDLPATVGFCATPPRAEIGPQKCSRISAPRSRGRTAWFSSRLTRRAAPLSRRPGCAPPPPTETCGRSPLAAPVVFLTGRSREQTRPRGRRSSWSPARGCGRARGGDRRRLGGQDCGRSKSVLR